MIHFGPPPPFPLADAVVSNANLLQLITATNAAAAAFIKIRGMPDYFHAQQEPSGCVCTSSFPHVSHQCHRWARYGSEVGKPWAGGGPGSHPGVPPARLCCCGWVVGAEGWTDGHTRMDGHTHMQLL